MQSAKRKCLALFFYFIDADFGLIHVRLQTWFPMEIQVYVNGHEWLARKLTANRIGYTKLDNAFTWIEDIERAQTEFHAADEATARSEREALQARLDGTRAQLEPMDADIRRLDTELADLRSQVEAGRADLAAQHNALGGRRRALGEEYNRLAADANGLIDALNWARW